MVFWIGVGVVLLVFFALAALGNRRRRGGAGGDPTDYQRNRYVVEENLLRTRSHPFGHK